MSPCGYDHASILCGDKNEAEIAIKGTVSNFLETLFQTAPKLKLNKVLWCPPIRPFFGGGQFRNIQFIQNTLYFRIYFQNYILLVKNRPTQKNSPFWGRALKFKAT